jgi:hypothetical protein
MHEKSNFRSRLKLIWAVQFLAQKYSYFAFSEIMKEYCHSAPTQGAYRDRHERGAECGGRGSCRQTSGMNADGEAVWSWRAPAGAKLARGSKGIAPTTVAIAGSPRRARSKP